VGTGDVSADGLAKTASWYVGGACSGITNAAIVTVVVDVGDRV
jgi:hypothetical protein